MPQPIPPPPPPPRRSEQNTHELPSVHAVPHEPQFASLFGTHEPLQHVSPSDAPITGAAHVRAEPPVPQRHTPPPQVSPALHERPHMPQFATLLAVSTHAPPQHA